MFNLGRLRKMSATAQSLGLDWPDTGKLLWSYYGSRLSGGRSRASAGVEISVPVARAAPLRVFLRSNGYDCALVEGILERQEYAVPLENVTRILDLGGNIGLATLFFARAHPQAQLCAVEPIAANRAVLERNVQLNRLSVRVIAGAAGASDGRVRFVLSQDPRQHISSAIGYSVQPVGAVEADVYSVPSLMRLMGWDGLDILKIDIEGGEAEVLGGQPAWLREVRAIVGEGHDCAGYTIERCRRDLEPMGFAVRLLEQKNGSMLFLARRPEASTGPPPLAVSSRSPIP